MGGRSTFENRWASRVVFGCALVVPLTACVGEIRKGTAIDPITVLDGGNDEPVFDDGAIRNEPHGPLHGDDAGSVVRGNGGDASVGGGGPDDAGSVITPPPTGKDAATPPPTGTHDASTPPTGGKTPTFVVVGYSGVRLTSKDLGKTWSNIVTSGGSGDDQNLLRGAAYGNGLFVAAGWRIWTSPDGVTWTERTNPSKQWMGGLQYGNNVFVGAGGYGSSIYSSDGITWMSGAARNTDPGRSVAFGGGKFMAGADSKSWWTTTDGKSWTVDSMGHSTNAVMWCKDHFSEPASCTDPLARNSGQTAYGEGVWVSAGSGYIERSEDGKTWTKVQDTSAYPVEGVAFGYGP